MMHTNKKTWLGIAFLILLEQVIKLIINNKYLQSDAPLLPPLLYFKPMFNRDYSWFNSMLQLGIGKWMHVALVVVLSFLIYKFYRYIQCGREGSKAINVLFAFVFSGAMCSLIDKVLWNGSLDYILVNGYFTFDLKDVYINVFIALLVFLIILKNKTVKEIEDKMQMKGFLKFLLKQQAK